MHFVTKLQPGKLRYKIFGVLQPGKVEVQKYLGCHSRGKLGYKNIWGGGVLGFCFVGALMFAQDGPLTPIKKIQYKKQNFFLD